MDNIGEVIKNRRKQLGLTQRELAGIAKVTQATVCQIEKGDRKIQYKTAISLANALGLELSDLGYESKPEDTLYQNKDSIMEFFIMLNDRQKKLTKDIEIYSTMIREAEVEFKKNAEMIKSIKNGGGFNRDE